MTGFVLGRLHSRVRYGDFCSCLFLWKETPQELGIPVGIIQRAYAGTPIEGWLPWNEQKNDPRSKAQKKLFEDTALRMAEKRGETAEKALAVFETELASYNGKIDAGETMKKQV